MILELLLQAKRRVSLFLINKELCHEDKGSGGIAPPFLTSALDGGERSASRPEQIAPVPIE
jgi:hypothetical protein